MKHKETYAEYTKTFPQMVEQLRLSETHPDAKIYREFILDNEADAQEGRPLYSS